MGEDSLIRVINLSITRLNEVLLNRTGLGLANALFSFYVEIPLERGITG